MNINDDLVTVIIPAYNHEKYVREAVESIIKQTYKNIEIIIIDDGSSDNTWNILNLEIRQKCENCFVRTIIEQQNHGGSISILNKGLNYSHGKYLYLFSSDDIAHPQAIEKLHANIGDAEMIFPDLILIDSDGKRLYLDANGNFDGLYNPDLAVYKTLHEITINDRYPNIDDPNFDFYRELLHGNFLNIGFLVKTQAVKDVGGWKGKGIEDYYMHLQIAKKYRIKRLKEVLYFYRKHSTNWSRDVDAILSSVRDIFMNEKAYCYTNGYRNTWDKVYRARYYKNDSFWNKLTFRISRFLQKKRDKLFN